MQASRSNPLKLLRRVAAEPMVQFLLVGAVLLTAQQLLAPAGAQAAAADEISISPQAVEAMKAAFAQENGRAPTGLETRELINRHADGEVLYREALRYGLDRSDVIVRREMQRKMRFLIEDITPLPDPSREALQAWLDSQPDRYARPERISFEQVFLSRAKRGENLEHDADRVLAGLRAAPDAYRGLSDPFPAGLAITRADAAQLEKHFGGHLAKAIFELRTGEWSSPLRSSLGVHIVRVTQREAARPATLAEAGPRLVVDYQLAQREQANRHALEKLRARYRIVVGDAS